MKKCLLMAKATMDNGRVAFIINFDFLPQGRGNLSQSLRLLGVGHFLDKKFGAYVLSGGLTNQSSY